MITLLVVAAVVVIVVVMLVGTYNRLVGLRQNANQAFADIDVQLKQRQDLIPNLVETVKGYAGHERGTLEAVTQARADVRGGRTLAVPVHLRDAHYSGAEKLGQPVPECEVTEAPGESQLLNPLEKAERTALLREIDLQKLSEIGA